jgi:hypothetical protein
MKLLAASILLALTALPLTAQDPCPHTRAATVRGTTDFGGTVDCDAGVNLTIGGVQLTSAQRACPLLATITPDHQEVEPTKMDTFAVDTDRVPQLVLVFRCTPHYLLFVRISDTCDLDRTQTMGGVQLKTTVSCSQPKGWS